MLDLSHHKGAMCTSDVLDRAQVVDHKILVVFHVPDHYFQKEIILAGYIVALCYFIN